MANYEFRRAGVVIGVQDFGRVLAGASGGPVTVQLKNTSGSDWLSVKLTLIQGDSDGGNGSATVGGTTLTATPYNAGALANGASLDIVLGWTTAAGTTGRVGDFADLAFTADY